MEELGHFGFNELDLHDLRKLLGINVGNLSLVTVE